MKKYFLFVGILTFAVAAGIYTTVRADITSNLTGWWTFDGSLSSGTVADSSGSNHNLTIQGTPSQQAGIIGNAQYFDGSTIYDYGGPMSNYVTNTDSTLSAWIKPVSGGGSCSNISGAAIMVDGTGSGGYLGLEYDGTNVCAGGYDTANRSISSPITANQWHLVNAVHTGGQLYLYVDGTLKAQTPVGTIAGLTYPLWVGKGFNGAYYSGLIDDARTYTRGLSQSDITQLWDAGYKPTVSITSPTSGSTYTTTQTVTVTASASDNVGVTKVEFYVDGQLITADTASPYQWSWNITNTNNGTHSITTKAYDAAGNVTTSSAVSITINIPTPPTSGNYSVNGWAWSTNTGWISFNCADTSSCGTSNYGVSIDAATGNMTGYAWSSYNGWIKFGGLAGQTVGGQTTTDAKVNLSTGVVSGWIRECTYTATGDCSTMASGSSGFDGWIELAGTQHPSSSTGGGVWMNVTSGKFQGKAWDGQDDGWIEFSPNTGNGVVPVTYTGTTTTNNPVPIANCNGLSPTSLPYTGGTVTANGWATDGAGPAYQYLWSADGTFSGSFWETATSKTFTYVQNNSLVPKVYSPALKVKDWRGTVSNASSCGNVTVAANTGSAALSLLIGPSSATASKTILQITQGQPFGLAWTNPYYNVSGYTCGTTIMPTAGQSAWGSTWGNLVSNGNTAMDVNNTTNVPTGYYAFTLFCDNNTTNDHQHKTVNLKITQVNETEK